jgi:hypothetical protein
VVEALQTALNEGRGDFAPESNPVLAIDGIYGPQTASAGASLAEAPPQPASAGPGCCSLPGGPSMLTWR